MADSGAHGRRGTPRHRALSLLSAAGEPRIVAVDVDEAADTLLCAARAFGVGLQVLREALDTVFAGRAGPSADAEFTYVVRELIRDGVAMTADVDDAARRTLAVVQAELDYLAAQMADLLGEESGAVPDDPYPLG
jgi:hypothetical protein